MSKNVILFPTYNYVDTCIIVECKNLLCEKKRVEFSVFLCDNLYFFVFNAYLMF